MNYFNQKSYTVIGHSYGGHLGFLYARLYPERVSKLVMIDTIYYDLVPVEYFNDYLRSRLETYIKLVEKLSSNKQPVYTYEEAKEKLMQSRETDPLSDKAANALLKRHLKLVGEMLLVIYINVSEFYFLQFGGNIGSCHDLKSYYFSF